MFNKSNNAYNLSFNCLSAMDYSPKIRKSKVPVRPRSSLLYVKEGKYRYTYDENTFYVNSGDMIYLPQGSGYRYEVVSDEACCLQFEFEVTDISSGESHILTDNPYVIDCGDGFEDIEALMKDIVKYHNQKNKGYDIMVTSLMCRMYYYVLTRVKRKEKTVTESRIEPAVKYIKKHFCEKIYVAHLANLCFMSESQLRRFFKAEFGMSPIEYKNAMQMSTACELLRTGKSSGEIADILGFDSVCSFSHMFKKIYNISPAQYARQCYGGV